MDANQISFKTTENSFSLTISGSEKIRLFSIDDLLKKIVVEESYYKVKTNSVSIFLKKSQVEKWPFVTKTEKKIQDNRDAMFREDRERSKAQQEDPAQGLMNLMKKMYQEGDEEMKRTIAKAMTESREKSNLPFP